MDIASILKKYPKRREFVLEILHDVQNHDPQSHLTESSIKKVAQHLNLPLAQVYGIVGYYSMFSTKPRGKYIIQVCKSTVCSMLGSDTILNALQLTLKKYPSDHTEQLFYIEETECLGHCSESPCMMINGKIYGNLTPIKLESIISGLK